MVDDSTLEEIIKYPGKIENLSIEELLDIINQAKSQFEEETQLLEFNNIENDDEVYVIGDIHGDLKSLKKFIELIDTNNPKLVIFLGDIVDRGNKQLECLIIILSLKILEPKRFIILRGNHEDIEINQFYGFFSIFLKRFNDPDKFNEILKLYNALPYCVILNKTILCLHGGIPTDYFIINQLRIQKRKYINEIILRVVEPGLFQLLWNDPKEDINGFAQSIRGPGIFDFGKEAFHNFMNFNNLNYLIRSHECFTEGFKWFFDKQLLSIFSAENYRGPSEPNPSSYAIIRKGMIIPMILK